MSTTTSLIPNAQAIDLERRLAVLEARVGMNRSAKFPKPVEPIDDRLSRIKSELDRKIAGSSAFFSKAGPSWKEIQKLLRELDPGIALTHQQQPLLYKRQEILAGSDQLAADFIQLDQILKLLVTGMTVDGSQSNTSEGKPEGPSAARTAKGSGSASSPSKTGTMPGGTAASPSKPAKPSSLSSSSQHPQQQQLLLSKDPLQQKLKEQLEREKGEEASKLSFIKRSQGEPLRLDQVTQAPILTQSYADALDPDTGKRVEDLRLRLLDLGDRTARIQSTLRQYLECYHTATMAVSEKLVLADELISAKAKAASQ